MTVSPFGKNLKHAKLKGNSLSIVDGLLPEFDHEMENTRKILACVPDDVLTWKPHEKSMTVGRLSGHIAELPSWGTHAITLDSLDIAPPPGQPFKSFEPKSGKELLDTFDRNRAAARSAIAGASDAHLAQPWTLLLAGKTIFTMPRTGVVRSVVMNHLIHHRAQLGVFLRLKNIAIPGMYGPSADEPNMFA